MIHGIHRLDVYFSCKKHAWYQEGLKSSIWERCKVSASAEQTQCGELHLGEVWKLHLGEVSVEVYTPGRGVMVAGGIKAPFLHAGHLFVPRAGGRGATYGLCQRMHVTNSRMSGH